MSIKRKLILLMMSISLIAVVLTVCAISAYLIYDIRKGKENQLASTAALTADRNSAALLFLNNEQVRSNLEVFRQNPAIAAACIYDAQGRLFGSYQAGGTEGAGCPPVSRDAPRNVKDMLVALQDIRKNGERIGTIFMVANMLEVRNYIHKIILISANASLLMLVLTLLIAVYFQRTVSKPILDLAATAQAITENRNYTIKAKSAASDETGVLAHAFNKMIDEVRKRDRELQNANETLEVKVAARTRELEEAKRRAETANETKSEFLRNMSHEFRTPLHALISFSSYGVKEHATAPPQQLKRYFEVMQKSAERLTRLVNEVLDLAKLEQGGASFSLSPCNIGELSVQAADMIRPLIEQKQILLITDLPRVPAMANCDQDKIMQVITNLLSNAVKFTPPEKRITLHIRKNDAKENPEIVVSLTDEGIGIPDEEKELVFESFRQSSRTNTGAGGTGLGLAICREIVGAHGGRIWAENNENGPGTRMIFTLPAAAESFVPAAMKKGERYERNDTA
jgi:signal transduction histidine kinase